MSLKDDIEDFFIGENGVLIDNPSERIEDIIKFIEGKVTEAVEEALWNDRCERD